MKRIQGNESVSEQWSKRLNNSIPWGNSTGSKATLYAPEEPTALVRGKGCRVWDVEGREFIDFRNGLGPITLGYSYPEVDEAIRAQLSQGIIYGHPHVLEGEVAELFCDLIPCAEQARFLKTGGEAISAAIRLARAYTGRDHVIQIGYNGWLNSNAIGGALLPGTQAQVLPGVPGAISSLHHSCGWNDIASLEQLFTQYSGKIAAIVIAADYATMSEGATFYPAARKLADQHGALLIYDEIVTGFRIAIAGVQEYFGVTPDMAVFSKGIANGMPLAVYAGRREVMSLCAPGKVSISSTFGGETLSLAAAKACMEIYQRDHVVGHLWRQGESFWTGVSKLLQKHHVPVAVQGLWPCPTLRPVLTDPSPSIPVTDLIPRFLRLAYKHGVSLYQVSYINFSHQDADIVEALQRLEQACIEFHHV